MSICVRYITILQLRDRVCMYVWEVLYMIPKLVQGVEDCPMGINHLVVSLYDRSRERRCWGVQCWGLSRALLVRACVLEALAKPFLLANPSLAPR